MKCIDKDNNPKPYMLAYIFDSAQMRVFSYGDKIFELIVSGHELTLNKYKIVFSIGDILDKNIYDDISPFIIDDEICSINKMKNEYKGYLFSVLVEDIELEIAKKIDIKLKNSCCDAYIGMTSIDIDSKDERKQFWKNLIRLFSIEGSTITCFGDEEGDFAYFQTAKENEFRVIFDGFPNECECENKTELFSTRQSSFISRIDQLEYVDGNNDSDRGLLEMNFALVKEVEISGVQIWKAIEDINQAYIPKDNNKGIIVDYIFTSLYQSAQGIERLFKIVIELIVYRDRGTNINKEKIDTLLLSHKHMAMYEFLSEQAQISLNSNCKNLLSKLEIFYSRARYARYSYSKDDLFELRLLQEYGKNINLQEDFNEKIKHLYGKALGQIAQTLYKAINTLSYQLQIFVYELNVESVANFVFNDYYDADLYGTLKKIEQAKSEFLWYLIKNGAEFSEKLTDDALTPLPFEKSDIKDYLSDIITNENSCHHIYNSVDYIYDEMIREDKKNWGKHAAAIKSIFHLL